MARKAAELALLLPLLSRGRSKATGQPFYIVPASTGTSAHWTATDGSGCTCIGYQRRGTCTHSTAARSIHERQQRPAAPAPLKRYEDLYPACAGGCGDLVEKRGQSCYVCVSNETRRLDDAAKRQSAFEAIPPFTLNPLAE